MESKACTACRKVFPATPENFFRAKNGKYGVASECKKCEMGRKHNWQEENKNLYLERSRASAKKYRSEHPEKVKEANRKHNKKKPLRDKLLRYSLTEEQYYKILVDQDFKCAICGTNQPTKNNTKKTWFVDHCHRTNKVRGLLCSGCNSGLGFLKDDKNVLISALKYLER